MPATTVLHSMQVKEPESSSGLESVVRVTVPLMAYKRPRPVVLISRIFVNCGKLKMDT